MNQFFYESRGKEKIKALMEEGMRSQAVRKSGASKGGLVPNLPKIALALIGILWLLGFLAR